MTDTNRLDPHHSHQLITAVAKTGIATQKFATALSALQDAIGVTGGAVESDYFVGARRTEWNSYDFDARYQVAAGYYERELDHQRQPSSRYWQGYSDYPWFVSARG
jgi:hypothetical protein